MPMESLSFKLSLSGTSHPEASRNSFVKLYFFGIEKSEYPFLLHSHRDDRAICSVQHSQKGFHILRRNFNIPVGGFQRFQRTFQNPDRTSPGGRTPGSATVPVVGKENVAGIIPFYKLGIGFLKRDAARLLPCGKAVIIFRTAVIHPHAIRCKLDKGDSCLRLFQPVAEQNREGSRRGFSIPLGRVIGGPVATNGCLAFKESFPLSCKKNRLNAAMTKLGANGIYLPLQPLKSK